ncbi:WXG100 family type VII secretion target [Rhodococcoides corynebacterioides]|uniref:WXG100 family type VII secretion target n=1 Tax=Rhodococcoides corynebacterioides TaxID=53972 RepID=A0ABS7P4N9_9NOCA|nr:WXG100 family type VII secretion target [Rhodococcus corynebacterioides]MBY6363162.1 WXG100 family type VII secretion target [Rhodococcus corynebacterioides]MBY6366609.1 WXG100 family type VII secretion target [Rhodococcus corynebacterioides]MBY6408672.1 WXG100 family type VII secretion target [Rhodococcus corynebacterioides]
MTAFRVELDPLLEVVTRLRAVAVTTDRHRADLDARVADLEVVWTGEAAAAHRRSHDAAAAGAREMADGLAAMAEAAHSAHAAYSAAVAANVRMFGPR